jgi:predicted DNA-binding transcriptional regulator AlpA
MAWVKPKKAVPSDNSYLLNLEQMAGILQKGIDTVYRWIELGKVPKPIRLGKAPMWVRQDVYDWLAAGSPSASEWQARRAAAR